MEPNNKRKAGDATDQVQEAPQTAEQVQAAPVVAKATETATEDEGLNGVKELVIAEADKAGKAIPGTEVTVNRKTYEDGYSMSPKWVIVEKKSI